MRLRDRLWLLMSQSVNALVFRGDPDESVSARADRENWPSRKRIDRWLGAGHCAAVRRMQLEREQRRRESNDNRP